MSLHCSHTQCRDIDEGPELRSLVPLISCTVNSEIFARVLVLRNFAYGKFRENKILTNC